MIGIEIIRNRNFPIIMIKMNVMLNESSINSQLKRTLNTRGHKYI